MYSMNNISRRLEAAYHKSTYSYSRPIRESLSNRLLAEFPTILDSFLTSVLNTTSVSIGVEGGGWWDSHEVAGSFRVKHFQGDLALTDAQLHSKYHKK